MGHRDHEPHTLTAPSALLTVDALVAGYSEPVVGPVSLTVRRGEIVCLAGANGSGKTTLLNALIGAARVFSGRITRDGSVGVSVLRQFPVRLPEMPLLGSELLRITGVADGDVPERLRPLIDRRIDRLSGGQFQLLQVWACLGSAAGLVVLDEPTNNMDSQSVTALADLLNGARDRGKGVLVISHADTLLGRACTHIIEVAR